MRKGSFQAGLNAFGKEVRTDAKKNARKVLFACLGGVITNSPVDTGMFRGNWNIQAKTADDSITESPTPQPEKANTVSFDVGDKIYISNALPYANRIEGGWSEQAPGGVVEPTIREVENNIKKGALDK